MLVITTQKVVALFILTGLVMLPIGVTLIIQSSQVLSMSLCNICYTCVLNTMSHCHILSQKPCHTCVLNTMSHCHILYQKPCYTCVSNNMSHVCLIKYHVTCLSQKPNVTRAFKIPCRLFISKTKCTRVSKIALESQVLS